MTDTESAALGQALFPVSAAVGIAETMLPVDLIDRLPATAAPAPWRTHCHITTWWHRPRRGTAELLPAGVRDKKLNAVIWTLVRYQETPVGPYDEIAAVVSFRGGAPVHIPFISVDSPISIVGGRVNWLLPKSLARFEWTDAGVTITADSPADPAWSLRATVRRRGWGLPFVSGFSIQQFGTDDPRPRRFGARMRGLAHPARVTVDGSASGPLAQLLRTGEFRGFDVTHARFNAKPPRT